MKSIDFEKKKENKAHHSRLSLKRYGRLCKRNKMQPHLYKVIELKEHGNWSHWTDYSCIHCGKREYICTWSEWPSSVEWSKKKLSKMQIVR